MPAAGRPNIVWLCTDQQRFDTIGALGNAHIRTPNIDSLGGGRHRLRELLCPKPDLHPQPSQFPHRPLHPRPWRVQQRQWRVSTPRKFWSRACLPQHGYMCGLIGKLHLSGAEHGAENRADDGYGYFQWSNMPRPEDGTSFNNAYHQWLRAKGLRPVRTVRGR